MEPQGTQRGRETNPRREVRAAGEAARDAARDVAGAARDVAQTRAEGMFESGKHAAVDRMHGMARALRDASSEQGGGERPGGDTARRLADRIDRFSQSIEARDLPGLVHEAEEYARREPALFLGGAFAAGFALARFLKASGERRRERFGSRYASGRGPGGYGPRPGAAVRPTTATRPPMPPPAVP